MLKKRISVIALVLTVFYWVTVAKAGLAGTPDVTAHAAILIEAVSGRVLYEKNANVQKPPASTTKIATAILALEMGKPQEEAKVSLRAASVGGSSLYLSPGEELYLIDLIKGALVKSGNDAAVTIAEHVAGSEALFSYCLNQKVRLVGGWQTNFVNPHGMPREEHYSSARDLALLARYALQNPAFAEIVRMREITIPCQDGQWVRTLTNTNKLLEKYPWADGVKTGTTIAAGACLVGSATKNGHHLITVVLHSGDRFSDTINLLEYGFQNYYIEEITPGQVVSQLRVSGGKDDQVKAVTALCDAVVVPVDAQSLICRRLQLPEKVNAPVKKGEQIGILQVFCQEEKLACLSLVADRDIAATTIKDHCQVIFSRVIR